MKVRRKAAHHLLGGVLVPHPREERKVDTTLRNPNTQEQAHPKAKHAHPHIRPLTIPHTTVYDYPTEDQNMSLDDVKVQVIALQQQITNLQKAQAPPPKVVKEYKGVRFEGDKGVQVEDFIYALENQFAIHDVVESAEKVLVLTSGVVGPAVVWVREWRTTHQAGTYTQLKQALIERFEDKT